MVGVTEALQRLEAKETVSLDELFENEEFLSTLIDASAAAIKTHEEEKLAALKAAVVNSAIGRAPEFAKRQIFMRYVAEFTVWHLKLLDLFNDPDEWGRRNDITFPSLHAGGRSTILERAYSELTKERPFYDQIWADLYSSGLVATDSLHVTMTGNGVMAPCTTNSGKEFLTFIRDSG